jgi:hypothetical protein
MGFISQSTPTPMRQQCPSIGEVTEDIARGVKQSDSSYHSCSIALEEDPKLLSL